MTKLKVLDLFAGTRSIARAFEARGHETFSIEFDEQHPDIDWYADMLDVTAEDIIERFGKPDVVWASPPCFTGETLVLTDLGFKEIKDVEIGDKVITHTNTYQTVTDIGRKRTNKIRVIKTSASYNINTTDEHPFYARKNYRKWNSRKRGWDRIIEDPEWIEAKDLENNWLVGHAINQKSIVPKWEGTKHVFRNQFGTETTMIFNTLDKYMGNNDFWWLIGRYIGDGWYRYKTFDVGIKNRYLFSVCCAKDELSEITSVLDRLGDDFKYHVSEEKATYNIDITKKEIVEFVMQFGRYAHGKKINNTIIDLPKDLLKSFLDGYFSADGHARVNNAGTVTNSATSVSKELLYGIGQCVMKVYNTPFSLAMYKRAKTSVIEGRAINQRDSWMLSYTENSTKKHSFVEDGILWSPVKDIQVKQEDVYVYNMSVENDNTYTANGAIVHNCTKFSVAAIGKHWIKGTNEPKTPETIEALKLLEHTVALIKELNPTFYFIENPRGKMRKMDVLQNLPRYTVTYCQYNDFRMKPTDIWTNHPEPNFKPPCKNGDPCHVAAPRGSQTGTQGIKGAVDRSRIPDKLTNYIVDITTDYKLIDINEEQEQVVEEVQTLNDLKYFINEVFEGEEDSELFTMTFPEVQERLGGIGYAAQEN